ncbi:hypothetical protein K432DRAFT_157141 [Lepidopterella palustris CBS 459.81]|uniref:RapZ C-terminal domain-containing protein n=1 Tax=Lepidopterella palustris CBS 459.81 TaxID=1314670 RepID=A0A8E2EHI5_9PEZI|nr:hypothetical protein K432DRAFT_157141 [Lepidopterella palustris CBS 459.81]
MSNIPPTRRTQTTHTSPPIHPILILYSHARTPPLHQPPDLKYDLRSIPNPPKPVRAAHDGRSKRLREFLRGEEMFARKLEKVEQDILDAMRLLVEAAVERSGEEREGEGEVEGEVEGEGKEGKEGKEEEEGDGRVGNRGLGDDDGAVAGEEGEEQEEENDMPSTPNDAGDEHEDSNPKEVILRVGCNCALGHHRSVAFVEELAQRNWPPEWHIEVIHRDLDNKRAAGTRAKQKAMWRGAGFGASVGPGF